MKWFRRRRMHNALHGVSQLVDSGMTFQVLGDHSADCACQRCRLQLSRFVRERIDQHDDHDEVAALQELWDAAHEQIALHCEGQTPEFLPGDVKNMRALKELARQWSEHPDYREAWDE